MSKTLFDFATPNLNVLNFVMCPSEFYRHFVCKMGLYKSQQLANTKRLTNRALPA